MWPFLPYYATSSSLPRGRGIMMFYLLHKLYSGMGFSRVGDSAQAPFSGTLAGILFPFPQLSFLLPIRPYLVREEVVQLFSLSSKTVVYTPPEYLKVKSQECDSGSTVLFLPGGNLGMKYSHYCRNGGVITEKQEILEIKTA